MASPTTPADRWRAALAAVLVQALLGYALIVGLAVTLPQVRDAATASFGLLPEPSPPPPPKLVPHRVTSPRPKGAASPPNLRSHRTEIVAPPPPIVLAPPPVMTATVAGEGRDATAGAADVVGPGTGAGGIGDGTGSGGAGDGDGDGGDTPPRWLRGRLSDADFPADAAETGEGGTVGVRYLVDVDGRAKTCRVTRSSGYRDLDALTCRLIEQRFRFAPSRDAGGRVVPSTIVENHSWDFDDR